MSVGDNYALCQRYKGRTVEIRTFNGRCHRGIIRHVDNHQVYIQPLRRRKNLGGFGYGFYGPGYGGYGGFGYGIALGSIATLALLPWFFW